MIIIESHAQTNSHRVLFAAPVFTGYLKMSNQSSFKNAFSFSSRVSVHCGRLKYCREIQCFQVILELNLLTLAKYNVLCTRDVVISE